MVMVIVFILIDLCDYSYRLTVAAVVIRVVPSRPSATLRVVVSCTR